MVKPTPALLVVDRISGVGAWVPHRRLGHRRPGRRLAEERDGIAGLAFLGQSAAWKQIESIVRPAFYLDLLAYRKLLDKPDTPFTFPKSLVAALAETCA